MAAQHLAAIKIQGAIRKFLYKHRKEQGKPSNYSMVHVQWQESRLLADKRLAQA